MFPEYRDLISELKNKDVHFQKLFELHNELDEKIKNIASGISIATDKTVEELKKEKLKLKDEMYAILQKAASKLRN